MRVTTRVKFLAAAAALVLLAACDSGTSGSGGVTGSGGAPVLANPPGAGVGQGGVNQGALGAGGVRAGSQEDLNQSVGDRIFYGSDRSDISPEARRTVEGWAQWLRQNPGVQATIEGHADERGTREYNLALGERRAAAARNALISMGIDPRRISTVSYGKERPQVLGSTEQAWAQNRRGVLLVN